LIYTHPQTFKDDHLYVSGLAEEETKMVVFENGYSCVGFEVFTAVVMKSFVFWDIMPNNPLKVN
jgi:hypothetical protein